MKNNSKCLELYKQMGIFDMKKVQIYTVHFFNITSIKSYDTYQQKKKMIQHLKFTREIHNIFHF